MEKIQFKFEIKHILPLLEALFSQMQKYKQEELSNSYFYHQIIVSEGWEADAVCSIYESTEFVL